jgi:hypothetical protein
MNELTAQQKSIAMMQVDLIDPIDDLDVFEIDCGGDIVTLSNGIHDDDYSRYEV